MTMQQAPMATGNEVFHRGWRMQYARVVSGYDTMKDFAALLEADRGTLKKYEETGLAKKSIVEAYAKHTGFRYEWIDRAEGAPTEEAPRPDGGPGGGLEAGSTLPASGTSLYHLPIRRADDTLPMAA